MLKKGTKAPHFELPNEKGDMITLSQFLGQKVVVYFYSKNGTSGCTRQAYNFKDNFDGFIRHNIKVIGISRDSVESHRRFIDKHELQFTLVSDPELIAIKAFDCWQEKTNFGKTTFGVTRTTFIINEEGVIEKVFEKANPDTNAEDILDYLSELNE